LGALDAGGGQDRLLLLAALDEALGLEPLQHLARRGARDAEHVGHARRDRALACRPVLADREREGVDDLQVLVDRVPLTARHEASLAGRGRGSSRLASTLDAVPLASVYPLVSTRSLARPFTYEVPEGTAKGAVVSVRLGRSATRGVVADVGVG